MESEGVYFKCNKIKKTIPDIFVVIYDFLIKNKNWKTYFDLFSLIVSSESTDTRLLLFERRMYSLFSTFITSFYLIFFMYSRASPISFLIPFIKKQEEMNNYLIECFIRVLCTQKSKRTTLTKQFHHKSIFV